MASIYRNSSTRQVVRNSSTPATVSVLEDGTQVAREVSQLNFAGSGVAVSETDGIVTMTINTGGVGTLQLNDLVDVTLGTPLNNQSLAYDTATTMWVNKTISGGDNPNNSKVSIAATPSSVVEADSGTVLITLVVTAPDDYTLSSVEASATDTNRDPIDVTAVSLSTYTFVASRASVGHYQATIVAHMVRDSDSVAITDTETVTVPVNQSWFSVEATSQPVGIDSMTDQGVFTPSGSHNLVFTTGGNSGTDIRTAYVALPFASSQVYDFMIGNFTASITNIATISTDYRLFSVDDFNDAAPSGQTLDLTIQEL